MKVKSSILLLSTVTLLAYGNSVVHADSSWESKISQLERQKEEIVSRLEDSYTFLVHVGDSWYLLQ